MLTRLLPSTPSPRYTGSRVSLWLLGSVLFVKIAIALGAIFNGHYAASVADGIPIDSFTPQGKPFLTSYLLQNENLYLPPKLLTMSSTSASSI